MTTGHTFDHGVRVLLCSGCGAPLELDPGATTATCGYCGATHALMARDETPLVAGPGRVAIDEGERLTRLRRQTGKPLTTPPGLQALVPNGLLEPWKVQEVFAVWQSTREQVRAGGAGGDYEAAERLLFLTRVLADHYARTEPRRQRAMFESALAVLTLPRHRQVVRGYLCREAVREGDLDAAEAWLAPCDPASDDLDTDTTWRVSRAFVDTARKDWDAVRRALGRTAAEVPVADVYLPMVHLLRANAVERTGDVAGAEALLQGAMGEGARSRATLETLRVVNRTLELCPASYPRAEKAYTVAAARAAGSGMGGIGTLFWVVGMGMNAVSLLAVLGIVVCGVVALAAGVVPMVVHLPRGVSAGLVTAASLAGGIAFTLGVMLPTTGPIGLVFWLLGRGLRNAGRRAQELRLNGRKALGRVLDVSPSGVTVNDVPQMKIKLRVELPDADPYEATATMLVPAHEAAALRGASVALRVDPKDRSSVLVETD